MLIPAEEVAREMVGEDGLLRSGGGYLTVALADATEGSVREARIIMSRVIECSRAEGANSERERLAAHAGRPAEEVAAEMVEGPYEVALHDGERAFACLIGDSDVKALLRTYSSESDAKDDRVDVVDVLSILITRVRAAAYAQGKADGVREERDRIAAALL